MLHLVGRQQSCVIFVETECVGYEHSHLLMIAGEHHSALYAKTLQAGHRLTGVGLYLVGDDDMSGVASVDGNMHHGTHVSPTFHATVHFGTHLTHHLLIAHADAVTVDHGLHAIACHLFDVLDAAVVVFVGVGLAQCRGDGVGRETLHVGGEMEQLVGIHPVGVNGINGKDTLGQRAGLVKNHCGAARKDVHVVAALDEDAAPRRAADAAKECQRHRDDQRTGTADHQERQRTIEPRAEGVGIA